MLLVARSRSTGVDVRMLRCGRCAGASQLSSRTRFIFAGTIKENIRYGKLDATDEQVIDSDKAGPDPRLYHVTTQRVRDVTGERGVKLSGGQKQRIANRPRVLEEPTNCHLG